MPFHDDHKRRAYQRQYYQKKLKPKRRKEASVEDRKMPVQFRMRASLVGRVMWTFHQGVANQTLPYKTPSEMYADLIFRGMETLPMTEDLDETLQYLRAVVATDALGAHRKDAQAAFSRVRTELEELLQIGAEEPARQYYWTTVRTFAAMSANIWRDWFLKQMATTFPKLAKIEPRGVVIADEPRTADRQKPKSKRRRLEQ